MCVQGHVTLSTIVNKNLTLYLLLVILYRSRIPWLLDLLCWNLIHFSLAAYSISFHNVTLHHKCFDSILWSYFSNCSRLYGGKVQSIQLAYEYGSRCFKYCWLERCIKFCHVIYIIISSPLASVQLTICIGGWMERVTHKFGAVLSENVQFF